MSVGRTRSIKPTFPGDEALGRCSRDARLLFACLWATCCDDFGRFRASPAVVRGAVFPFDDDLSNGDVARMLSELESERRIVRYEVDGQAYGAIPSWPKNQRIDNAGRPDFPAPPGDLSAGEPAVFAADDESSPQLAATRGEPPLDRIGKERIGEASPRKRLAPDSFAVSDAIRSWAQGEPGLEDVDLEMNLEACLDWHRAKGTKAIDWDAVYRNWLRKGREFGTLVKQRREPHRIAPLRDPSLRAVE